MPSIDPLNVLVPRARESDAEAFTTLVARAESVLLPGAATVVGSIGQLQAAARCTVVAMRHGLSTCPISAVAYASWVEALLMEQLDTLVPRAVRRGVPGEDDLSRLVAQAGLMAMRQDGAGTMQLARTVRQRIGALPPGERSLIDARYRHLQSLEGMAEGLGRDVAEVAGMLCRIRDGLHPDTPVIRPPPAEALATEMAIAAKPGADERQWLMAAVAADAALEGWVVRQGRIHLLLHALLVSVDQERTRRLAAVVGVSPASVYPDEVEETSGMHQLDSQVTFGESKPKPGQANPSTRRFQARSRSTPPRVPSQPADGLGQVSASPDLLDEPRQHPAMRLLMPGMLVLGLALIGIMWWAIGGDGQRPVPPAPRPVAVPSTTRVPAPPAEAVRPAANAPDPQVATTAPAGTAPGLPSPGAVRVPSIASSSPSLPVPVEVSRDGALLQQWWEHMADGIGVGKLLRQDPRFPDHPDRETLLTGSLRNPDCHGIDHARRIQGYLIPPMGGSYLFGVCSDDSSQVYLSIDDQPANKRLIMEVKICTEDNAWDSYPTQRSAAIPLLAGRRYYWEILHHQGKGFEYLQVGWTRPDGVVERPIPIKHFTPLRMPLDLPVDRTGAVRRSP